MSRGTLGLLLLATSLVGCPPGTTLPGGGGGGGGGGGSAGAGISSECLSGGWGTGEAALKLTSFLGSTAKFVGAAADLQDSLTDTCKSMGRELGLSDAEMSGAEPVRAACNAVSARLRDELGGLRAEANLRIEVAATPPRCEVSVNAYAECAASCDVDVEPGSVEIECEGGHLVGQCNAQCTGECNVDVQGECSGSCEGSCSAGCSGTCQGVCEGNCSSKNAEGQCNGSCDGTCHGTCSAGCQGSCEGECWVSGQASCSGECRGGCSVDYEAPRCTGEVKPPNVSAECQASCDAQLNAEATCEPGQVEVVVIGDVSDNVRDRVERVRGAIRAGWAGIETTRERLRRLQASGRAMADAAGNLKGAVRGMGAKALRAGACVTEAAAAIPEAVGSIGVSFEVSVEVSASASASAG